MRMFLAAVALRPAITDTGSPAGQPAAEVMHAPPAAKRTGFNCSFVAGLEYIGGDLLPEPEPVATADACCKLCSEHNACAYWVFDTELKKEPPTQPAATHHCYLKNDQITVGKSSRFVSGPPAPPSPPPGAGGWHNPCAGKQSSSPWCDEAKTNADRAQALVAAMTVEEKAAMMSARANPGIARLDVGVIHFSEALHGLITTCLSEQLCPTAFPAWIGMAASFDQKLWEDVATTIGTEGRAYANTKASHTGHALAFWAPNINMVRDPNERHLPGARARSTSPRRSTRGTVLSRRLAPAPVPRRRAHARAAQA